MDELIKKIVQWHHDRNLIDGSTDEAQFKKLLEEFGEFVGNLTSGKCVKDDIGDMLVVLINMAERNDVDFFELYEERVSCAAGKSNPQLKLAIIWILSQTMHNLIKKILTEECVKNAITETAWQIFNAADYLNISTKECLEIAYEDIKDRKGKMIDGVFVKNA